MPVPTLHDAGADSAPRRGRAHIEHTTDSATRLSVVGTGGRAAVTDVAAVPDRRRAAQVRRSLDRVMWQKVERRGGHERAVVAGVSRRRPTEITVSLPTALGLLESGVPTIVDMEGPR